MKTHYVGTLYPNLTATSKGRLPFLQSKICLITFSDILFIQMTKDNESLEIYFNYLVIK